MKKLFKLVILTLISCFLASCSQSKILPESQKFMALQLHPDPEKAVVYFYRVSKHAAASETVDFIVKDRVIGKVIAGFFVLSLEEGTHEFKVTFVEKYSQAKSLNLEKGKMYFLKMEMTMAMNMFKAGDFTIHLDQIKNEEEALKDLHFLSMLEVNKN